MFGNTRSLPAMSSAIFFASAAVLARPNFGVGTPASWEKLSWRRWPTFKRLMETSNQRYMAENSFWLKWTTFKRLMETCSCTDSCLCCWTPDTTAGRTCHTKFYLCLFWNHVEDKQGLHLKEWGLPSLATQAQRPPSPSATRKPSLQFLKQGVLPLYSRDTLPNPSCQRF